MADNVRLNTVREGVSLIAGLLREADAQSRKPNDKISTADVRGLLNVFGDGAELDEALLSTRKYAAERLGGDARRAPTSDQVDTALGTGMRSIARAGRNGELSGEAYEGLAPTWKKIVDFAVRYEGYSVADLTQPSE